MSDGDIGQDPGVTYWATINIRGNLKENQLKAVVKKLKDTMKLKVTSGGQVGGDGEAIDGVVVQAVRTSGGKTLELGPSISVALDMSKKPQP